ncbi:ATP-binding protein [Pseudomonas nabeulensis]|uniref:ATP-binding protein n=1 Tax=Pseudomonas nabeulensis TaxID=2293833 RepID=A0A4Z0B640_9PSED|nr:ATP-binding protein [Pseudomonas nabeulensis]TFY93754.1 ATP-binding protein [Pseudomonas nabeulensis]
MKEYQLNVDPRILELLGPNLYTNIYYVLAELIANAYDADAKNVYIIANPDDIRIEDDGHGMSYDKGDITKYLNIAGVSRVKEADSFSKSGKRRKMGRKGVGKLAALSVSENVDILTVADGEKSGFVLSRHPDEGSKLKAISESDITFEHVKKHGSAIVMRNPQYRLHKTLSAVKRNLLKIFPLVNADFRIHVIRGKETVIVNDFDKNVMSELGTLITLGDEYSPLTKLVPNPYPKRRSDLVSSAGEKAIPRVMMGNDGIEHEYTIKIAGWIGTYKTTRGRKAEMSDFPDNFISLFANKKMGEFNILPVVGQNKLNEVYVVGQLHVDIFELTELPDMALSNRQGYKSDDPRYVAVLDYVRKELLTEILKKREVFTDIANAGKKQKKQDEQKGNEAKLRRNIDAYRKRASEEAADDLFKLGSDLSREAIEKAISDSLNKNSPDLGLKSVIDSQKKRILISQTSPDKSFADIIYQMLIYNNVSAEDILYTNCDDEVCRVPEGKGVYEYLRDFFVESYSTQKIFVLFVTSENTKMSWGAITEIGASWITQVDHKIFNVHPFKPEHPLNNDLQWQNTNREEPTKGELWMIPLNADVFCQKIEAVCDAFGYKKNERSVNKAHLGTLISIRNS